MVSRKYEITIEAYGDEDEGFDYRVAGKYATGVGFDSDYQGTVAEAFEAIADGFEADLGDLS